MLQIIVLPYKKILLLMPIKLIDSHCHLDLIAKTEKIDVASIVKEAKEHNVEYMLSIATSIENARTVIEIASGYENVFASSGIHPLNVNGNVEADFEELRKLALHPKVIAIGETGLDFYKNKNSKEEQIENFKRHIEISQETGLPIIIHTRNAEDETAKLVLDAYKKRPFSGVLHCFTSGYHLAAKLLEIGFFVSFSGIVTFPNANDVREVARKIPLEKLLIETDSPYLAPIPYRGKGNRPHYVRQVADYIAELFGVSPEEIYDITFNNFFTLFKKACNKP